MRALKVLLALLGLVLLLATGSEGFISKKTWLQIRELNKHGHYLGLVVPSASNMNRLLKSPSFSANEALPYLDAQGKRFRFGTIGDQKVIVIMTGLSMLNAGSTTQLLLSLFQIRGVVHWGVAGNANSNLEIGDVTIPQYWAHLSLWNWQRFGDGPENELALESNGDFTREYGFLNFSDFGLPKKPCANSLNSIWYQPEQIFPIDGTSEEWQHVFWVQVNKRYYNLAKKLEGMALSKCVNATMCLTRNPKVVLVNRGGSANIYTDNAAYREFLRSKYDISPIDMESASVALFCLQFKTPFIAIRSLSNLAGGGSSNEANIFGSLAAQNAVDVTLQFISLLTANELVDDA